MLILLLILCCAQSLLRILLLRPRFTIAVITIAAIVVTSANPTKTSFAEDRSNRASLFDRKGNDDDDRAIKNRGRGQQQVREGTRIPPTVGRIVVLGRRWAFVPASRDASDANDLVDLESTPFRAQAVGYDGKPRPTRLGGASTRSIPMRTTAATLVRKDDAVEPASDGQIPHIVLSENLMLQRIVEAIRADSTDDRWMVSGEFTEFFKENRLTIRTAQRANSN